MPTTTTVLASTAALIGFLHTVMGPDHYLPLAVTARAGSWRYRRLVWVVLLCGTGHVLSSVVLGALGLALGASVTRLAGIETLRGELAAWALLAFGVLYALWGLRRASRSRPHTHWHSHEDGVVHRHRHAHHGEHLHPHGSERTTGLLLFSIFLLGPCEPLIPLLMFPAAENGLPAALFVAVVFGVVTVVTMLAAVSLCWLGLVRVRVDGWERWSHAAAGVVVALSAAGILFLGL